MSSGTTAGPVAFREPDGRAGDLTTTRTVPGRGGLAQRLVDHVQEHSPIASSVRLALLLIAGLLAPVGEHDRVEVAVPLGIVLLLGLLSSTVVRDARVRSRLQLAEAVVASAGVVLAGAPVLSLLLCLPAAAVGAGLSAGYVGATTTTGAAAGVLLLGRLLLGDAAGRGSALSAASAQWVLVALVCGLLAGRIHRLGSSGAPSDDRYAEAYRLLAQLRAVTRGLPGSLDPGSVARTLLEECVGSTLCEHGSVLLDVGGDQLVPLALHGYQRVPWRASLSQDGPIQRSWLSGAPVLDRRLPDRDGQRTGSELLVLPMTVEGVRVGVVALESRRADAFDDDEVARLHALVGRYALPLETAALFDELRIRAAQEERTRLAREMHDGIAQDLAFLGYQLDALTAMLRNGSGDAVAQARGLRRHITGLISDLRLSLSDLRSSIGPSRGLGAALSEYARSAGTSSGITVHMTLTEGSTRLSADTEVQMLRIAHEAVSRARRRPGTANLWVTLAVDPPSALLLVEDDSPSSDEHQPDQHSSTKDMQARAERLVADFSTGARQPKGTYVRVAIDGGST